MNFFKDKELALRFKNNEVPSKERFLYLLISMVLVSLGVFLSEGEGNQRNLYTNTFRIITLISCIIICYNTNKSGDDKDFIDRYLCLGIPVAIRTIVLTIPACIVLVILSEITNPKGASSKNDGFYFLHVVIFQLYFTWRLNSAIKIASH